LLNDCQLITSEAIVTAYLKLISKFVLIVINSN